MTNGNDNFFYVIGAAALAFCVGVNSGIIIGRSTSELEVKKEPLKILSIEHRDENSDGLKDIIIRYENGDENVFLASKNYNDEIEYEPRGW